MDAIQKHLLEQVADIHEVPQGAYSLRINGSLYGKNSSENITIEKKTDKPGIDIFIKAGTKNESLHIPVILSQTGIKELVYNDFHIGEDCDVTIVAGCGIHNSGSGESEHSGIHSFFVGKNARVKYIEKHYGEGDGNGKNVMNPTTVVVQEENSYLEMETAQIKGVDSTTRNDGNVTVLSNVKIVINKLLQSGLRQQNGNVQTLVFGARLDVNINTRLIVFLYDADVFRVVFSIQITVDAQGIRALRNLVNSRNLLQKIFLNRIHYPRTSLVNRQPACALSSSGRISFFAPYAAISPPEITMILSAMSRMRS